jgi:F420-dependent oxidoreductase-like protein
MKLAIMLEGQDGLNWPRWQRIVRLVEDAGFHGLFRSDHFTNSKPPNLDSLELWVSLTWLAANTQRIDFGPLVTPMSARHPVFTARMGYQLDDLSGGRLTLGLGAGWQEREHSMFGFDLLDVPGRFARLEEALEVVTRLLNRPEPVTYEGKYYRLREAELLPRPARKGGPPILIGGNGAKLTLPLAARYGHEWNAVYLTPDKFKNLNAQLDDLLGQHDRQPGEVRRSMMTGLAFGRDPAEAERKSQRFAGSAEAARQRGVVAGTPGEVVEQLGRLAEAGLQRIMLQWLELDDLDGLEALAHDVLPQV